MGGMTVEGHKILARPMIPRTDNKSHQPEKIVNPEASSPGEGASHLARILQTIADHSDLTAVFNWP